MRHTKKKTSDDEIAHFQKRCLERIGCILSQRKLKELLAEGKIKMLCKQSCSKTLFIMKKGVYPDKDIEDVVLAYDKTRHTFVTAIPYEAWKKNHDHVSGARTDKAVDPLDPPIWA